MKKTKILYAVAVAALVSPATSVVAADSSYDWSGLYVGLDAGYQGGGGDLTDTFCDGTPGRCTENDATSPNFGLPGTFVSDTDLSDIVGGGHVGFNHQFSGGFVVGAELNLGMGGESDGGFLFGGNFGNTELDNDAKGIIDLGLTGAARLQAGYGVGRFMPYVSVGLAAAKFEANYIQPDDINAPRSGKGQFVGWTIGAGLKYAVHDNFIIGAQYAFTDYGSDEFGLKNAALDNDSWNYRADLKTHDVRLSASYKF
jgi:outer membrane immunogenic protein